MTRTERRERHGTRCRLEGGCKECGQGRLWKRLHRRLERVAGKRAAAELTPAREGLGL